MILLIQINKQVFITYHMWRTPLINKTYMLYLITFVLEQKIVILFIFNSFMSILFFYFNLFIPIFWCILPKLIAMKALYILFIIIFLIIHIVSFSSKVDTSSSKIIISSSKIARLTFPFIFIPRLFFIFILEEYVSIISYVFFRRKCFFQTFFIS